MANKKITELPDAVTPLAGTEYVEIVQGGSNKKVTVNNVGGGGGSGYSTIEQDGSDLTQRTDLNVSNGLTAADDALNSKTTLKLGGDLTGDTDILGSGVANIYADGIDITLAADSDLNLNGAVINSQATSINNLTADTSVQIGITSSSSAINLTSSGVQINVGSDATGDMHYRAPATALYTRLPVGTLGQVLMSLGSPLIPTWSNLTSASETSSGVVELATDAETITGTDNTRATHPAGVHAKVVGLQDLFIPSSAMWPRVTAGCSYLTRTEIATSLFNIQSLDFDPTTQEFAQFQVSLPRNWNNGTITAKVYWTATSGAGTVQWGISGGAYSNDDALTVAFGTAQTVDDTLIAANDLHITDATSAITLEGTPADADFIALQVSRNPASDTLNADAKLLGVIITITTDAAKAA